MQVLDYSSETATDEVKHRGSARVDFPFILGANIRGRVLAAPQDGEKADAATGAPDVLVVLKPGVIFHSKALYPNNTN